jgi:hypothetical protein
MLFDETSKDGAKVSEPLKDDTKDGAKVSEPSKDDNPRREVGTALAVCKSTKTVNAMLVKSAMFRDVFLDVCFYCFSCVRDAFLFL